jgi:4-amino-4-deoxy-L-arabinose transferase-like glycosyltransferase
VNDSDPSLNSSGMAIKTCRMAPKLFWLIFVISAIFSGIADITHFRDLPEQLIGRSDQANTANVARNIIEGKGATTDAIWLLTDGGIPGNAIPQPESYWSVYLAYIVAISFSLFGAGLKSLLIPAVIAKTATAALAAFVTLKIGKSFLAASACGAFLLFHPVMTSRLNGQSDIYLTLCILAALMLLISGILSGSRLKFLAFGVCTGIAIGIKPSGGLLIGLLVAYLLFSGSIKESAPKIGLAMIGVTIGVAPFILHNETYFGTTTGPGFGLVSEAARISYLTSDHNKGFFDPEPFPTAFNEQSATSPKGSQSVSNINQFIVNLANGELIPSWQMPFIFLLMTSTIINLRSFRFLGEKNFESQFFYQTILLTSGGVLLGFAVHFEARYWNFLVPLFTVITTITMVRTSKYLPWFMIGITAFAFFLDQRYFTPVAIPAGFAKAQRLLPSGAVVLTPEPWEFAFHTHLKAVVLPYTDKPDVIEGISKRYQAEYLVIIDDNIRHEFYRPIVNGHLPSYLTPVFQDDSLLVAKFNWK